MRRTGRHYGGGPWTAHLLHLTVALLLIGCASVQTESTAYGKEKADSGSAAAVQQTPAGPKKLVQVIQFGVPAELLKQYRELADRRVGWGLCNWIVEGLYDTGRFDYVEDKGEFLKRVVELWTAEEAGIFFKDDEKRLQAKSPDYLVYAEVFDFGVSQQERIVGTKKRQVTVTKIGVQVRFVDTRTMQYTPGSANGESALEKGGNVWSGLDKNFDQTQIGLASEQAIREAIQKVLQRLDQGR